jgi:ADP-heptose:LPS heptosyltransferase
VDHIVPDVERIVVLRANGLGDAVIAEPALAAVRAAYPTARITLVTSPGVAALLDGRPHAVDEVLVGPRVRGVCVAGPEHDPPEVVEAFCARMRARRFDLALQLHGGGGNANPLLLRFGARVTAGSRAPGAPALDRTVPWTSHQHDLLRFLEVVALVGAEPVRLAPRIAVTPADRAAAEPLVPPGPGPLVVLHPGATDPRRRWPPHRLGEVGAALVGARVVVAGGPGDDALLEEIRAGLGGAPATVVRPSLPGLLGLLERADLMIGNDSGPRHLAEAVGTATVGVFTRANLVDVAPLFRARHRVHVSWTSACEVCGRDVFAEPCDHDATVLADVPVTDVAASAADLLGLRVREHATAG